MFRFVYLQKFLFMFEGLKRNSFEKKTVYQMIEIYCHNHHNVNSGLCDSCQEIYDYVVLKYDRCPFGENKPVCSKCKVHCYRKDKREKIREIMRYSGSRMLLKHPLNTILYFYHKITIHAPDKVPARQKVAKIL